MGFGSAGGVRQIAHDRQIWSVGSRTGVSEDRWQAASEEARYNETLVISNARGRQTRSQLAALTGAGFLRNSGTNPPHGVLSSLGANGEQKSRYSI